MNALRSLLIAAHESCDFKEVTKTRGVRITNKCIRFPLCHFCNYPNEPISVLSVNRVVKQIRELKDRGVKSITLVSGWLGYQNEIAVPYVRSIKSEMPDLIVNGAFGPISKKSLESLKKAGMDRYGCNLEAVPNILVDIKGTNDIPERLETLKNAREAGLRLSTGFIIGVGETEGQLMELLRIIRKIDPDSVFMSPFEAYPNTPMENFPTPSLRQIIETVAKTKLMLKNKTMGLRLVMQHKLIPLEFVSLAVFVGVSEVAPPLEKIDMSVEGFHGLLRSCIQDPEGTGQDLLRRNISKNEIREFLDIIQILCS